MTGTTDRHPTIAGITRLLDEWSGALVSRGKVVDGLLDLRSEVASHPAAVARVDEALRTMPGQTVVTREWAIDTLLAVDAVVAAAMPAGATV